MIGANNICADMCSWEHPETYPETRRLELIKTFRYIRDNMPRTIVNILLTPGNMNFELSPSTGIEPMSSPGNL